MLGQLLLNLVTHPGESRYRRFRASNGKIRDAVMQFDAVVAALGAAGFQSKFLPRVEGADEKDK